MRYGKRWVSKNGKNRIAYPTKKQALFNFYKRRERYIRILKARLNESEQILKEVQKELQEVYKCLAQ
jgi:glutaredoxin 2